MILLFFKHKDTKTQRKYKSLCLRVFVFNFFFLIFTVQAYAAPPKAVYLTWQRQPDTTMTVQWLHAGQEPMRTLFYRRVDQSNFLRAESETLAVPYCSQFHLHRIELTGLNPDSEYVFQIAEEPREYHFRTLPSTLKEPIRFVVGGMCTTTDWLHCLKSTPRQLLRIRISLCWAVTSLMPPAAFSFPGKAASAGCNFFRLGPILW